MKKKLNCLFDMDGTLTPAREKMSSDMLEALKLLNEKFNIGIVSGSIIEYIQEQCSELLASDVDLDIYPCNGTSKFEKRGSGICLVEENNMIDRIGEENFKVLTEEILRKQLWLIKNFKKDFLYTGTYIQYRGSMINWCMCGRDSGKKERDAFSNFEKETHIRKLLVSMIKNSVKDFSDDLNFVVGGSTSIDIYPAGWDKTFCLKHYNEKDTYFVGDACEPGRNDFEIYDKLSPRSFKVSSPEETLIVIDKLLRI